MVFELLENFPISASMLVEPGLFLPVDESGRRDVIERLGRLFTSDDKKTQVMTWNNHKWPVSRGTMNHNCFSINDAGYSIAEALHKHHSDTTLSFPSKT